MKTVNELNPSEFVLPPLHQVARQRDVAKVRELLAQGYDVNEADPRSENGDGGNTPLWYAAQGVLPDGVSVARELIAAGAQVNRAGEFGMTPLHMACSWGHYRMVEYLYQNGADLSIQDEYGRTPAALAKADYADGLAMPAEHRLEGWDRWLQGMRCINEFFDDVENGASWWQIFFSGPDSIAGTSILKVLELAMEEEEVDTAAMYSVDWFCESIGIHRLKKNWLHHTKVEDVLRALPDVNQFEWGYFFFVQGAAEAQNLDRYESLRASIAKSRFTITAADNTLIFLYTRNEATVKKMAATFGHYESFEISHGKLSSLNSVV